MASGTPLAGMGCILLWRQQGETPGHKPYLAKRPSDRAAGQEIKGLNPETGGVHLCAAILGFISLNCFVASLPLVA